MNNCNDINLLENVQKQISSLTEPNTSRQQVAGPIPACVVTAANAFITILNVPGTTFDLGYNALVGLLVLCTSLTAQQVLTILSCAVGQQPGTANLAIFLSCIAAAF